MIIPPDRLTEDVLRSIIENFVTREGTDYGEMELSLDEKVANLLPKVLQGDVAIVFDEKTESVNLLSSYDFDISNNSA